MVLFIEICSGLYEVGYSLFILKSAALNEIGCSLIVVLGHCREEKNIFDWRVHIYDLVDMF